MARKAIKSKISLNWSNMDLVHDSPPQISVLSFVSKLTADD